VLVLIPVPRSRPLGERGGSQGEGAAGAGRGEANGGRVRMPGGTRRTGMYACMQQRYGAAGEQADNRSRGRAMAFSDWPFY
jgi:hypothetical protein